MFPCTHISFNINMSLIQSTPHPPRRPIVPPGRGRALQFENLWSIGQNANHYTTEDEKYIATRLWYILWTFFLFVMGYIKYAIVSHISDHCIASYNFALGDELL
jgi:hypothetical protein